MAQASHLGVAYPKLLQGPPFLAQALIHSRGEVNIELEWINFTFKLMRLDFKLSELKYHHQEASVIFN
jgi:hypothetical protein